MSTIDFAALNTPEAFKAFLQAYHTQLSGKRSFPPLGLQKALHTAAPVFGHTDWNTMSAALQDASERVESDNLREVIVITCVTTAMDSGTIEEVDTSFAKDNAEAHSIIASIARTKISNNGRPVEEVMECRAIRTPNEDDGIDDMEDDEIVEWIFDNNPTESLMELIEYLDYELTNVTMKRAWV